MDHMTLGATPFGEECAQVGDDDYTTRSNKECRAFLKQFVRHIRANGMDPETEGFRLKVKCFSHDYGTYREVVATYDTAYSDATKLAFWCEANQPELWDEQAREDLGLTDPPAPVVLTLPDALSSEQRYKIELSEYHNGSGQWEGAKRFDSYWVHRDPEPGEDLSYGQVEPNSDGAYIMPEYLSGSDYNGGLVTKSNYQVFLEKYREVNGVHTVSGGHGTYAVAVRIDALTPEMVDDIAGLSDYPLLDEDHLSNLELEQENEAWESYGADDMRHSLAKEYPGTDDRWSKVPNGILRSAFALAADEQNICGGPGYEHTVEGVRYDFDEMFKRANMRSYVLAALGDR